MSTEFKIENDLPEFRNEIESMKQQNAHFANINNAYSEVNQTIAKMEKGGHFVEQELEALKKQRLQMKDEILSMLKKAA